MWPSYRFGWTGGSGDEFGRLHDEVNRLFHGYRGMNRFAAVNVWTSDSAVKVVADMPGVDPKDLDVQIEGDTVEIRGERKALELVEGERYLQRDRRCGSFRRIVELPYEVQSEDVKAQYRNGRLEITLPRHESTKPQKIEIKTS